MDVITMLREYPHITDKVRRLNEELNSILQNRTETYSTLQAAKLTGVPGSTDINNPTLFAVENIIDVYTKRMKYIESQLKALFSLRENVNNALQSLSPIEYRIIELRYFQCLGWVAVSRHVNYSREWCITLHKGILKRLKKHCADKKKCPT